MIYLYNKILSGNKKEQISVQNIMGESQKHYIQLNSSNCMIYFCEFLEFEKLIYNGEKNLRLLRLRVEGGGKQAAKGIGRHLVWLHTQ